MGRGGKKVLTNGDSEDGVGDGEFLFGGIEDDVLADGHDEERYGGSVLAVLALSSGRGDFALVGVVGCGSGCVMGCCFGARVEVRRSVPVVVEEGVFV